MFGRIIALIIKELTVLWKDPATRRILLIPPLIQVILFSYAATFDVSHVPLAVWNEDRGAQSSELVRRFAASPAFRIIESVDAPAAARKLIDDKDAGAVLHIPPTFSADVLGGRAAQAQFLLDGRRSNTALLVSGYAAAIVRTFDADQRSRFGVPIILETRDWFNATLNPQWFILPGLVAVLSLILSILVSALSLARERELGTFEQMLVTPLRPFEIMIGKAVPALIVGMIEANIVVLAALIWFRLPMTGNLLILEGGLLIYVLAGTGVGLAISSFARTQQQAILAVFIFVSPAIVLSGFAAPVENQPYAVQWLSLIDPVRYMLVIARGVFLQAMPFSIAFQSIWPMALIAIVLLGIATAAVRRALS